MGTIKTDNITGRLGSTASAPITLSGDAATFGDINISTGKSIKNAAGTALLTEAGALNNVTLGSSVRGSWTLSASQTPTSVASVDFTGIPAGVKQIVVMAASVSLNSTPDFLVQLGTGSTTGGIETSGYLSRYARVSGTHTQTYNDNAGFRLFNDAASLLQEIVVQLYLQDSTNNTWVATSMVTVYSTTIMAYGGGTKSLSGELTQVRFTSLGDPDTLDAGSISIQYI
jgi:hypothetical protein